MKIKLKKKQLMIFALIFFFFILKIKIINAFNMESSRYQIKSSNINITSGNKASSNYRLSDTVGQTAAGEFHSQGFIVKAGFQYVHSIIPFRFSLSTTKVNFGTIVAQTPATQTITLTVSFGAAGSYQVTVVEDGPMRTFTEENVIADTSCDGGSNTCTEYLAKPWTSSSAYGFGYNMSGQDIPSDFINSTYYRPFPDRRQNESPAVVMASNNIGKNRQATMTLKINVSPIQPAGSYQTVINFVATPSF